MKEDIKECEKCDDVVDNMTRLTVLESKYGVIETQSTTVHKLSTKVSLLLTLMSFIVCIVGGGAVYTFTGISNFKIEYAESQVEFIKELSLSQAENREVFRDSIFDLTQTVDRRLNEIERSVDNRFDGIEKNMVKMETKLDLHVKDVKTGFNDADDDRDNKEEKK